MKTWKFACLLFLAFEGIALSSVAEAQVDYYDSYGRVIGAYRPSTSRPPAFVVSPAQPRATFPAFQSQSEQEDFSNIYLVPIDPSQLRHDGKEAIYSCMKDRQQIPCPRVLRITEAQKRQFSPETLERLTMTPAERQKLVDSYYHNDQPPRKLPPWCISFLVIACSF